MTLLRTTLPLSHRFDHHFLITNAIDHSATIYISGQIIILFLLFFLSFLVYFSSKRLPLLNPRSCDSFSFSKFSLRIQNFFFKWVWFHSQQQSIWSGNQSDFSESGHQVWVFPREAIIQSTRLEMGKKWAFQFCNLIAG